MNYIDKNRNSEKNCTELDEVSLIRLFERCFLARREDASLQTTEVFRLFNGFYEGVNGLTVDRFGKTIVVSNHHKQPQTLNGVILILLDFLKSMQEPPESILIKTRHARDPEERKGKLVFGDRPEKKIVENGISYALNLRMNQDNSFYPDTRSLRIWLKNNNKRKSVLNCFAYTGTLGIAALAGGAGALVQTDINRIALELARRTAELNQLDVSKMLLLEKDFFSAVGTYKKNGTLFDTVILDSPFFSSTRFGRVDLQKRQTELINKVRPLVGHGGKLVLINNALYVSGKQYMESIEQLQSSGYLKLNSIIPIPEDITGYPETKVSQPPLDPRQINHPTKIVLMDVTRKDGLQGNYLQGR